MKIRFPYRSSLVAFKKRFNKRRGVLTKKVTKRFHFVEVWKKVAFKWLRNGGAVIVRVSPPWLRKVGSIIKIPFAAVIRRLRRFLARRPHRSFRLTRRRDYKRSLNLPGYWSFTNSVRVMLWSHKKLFGGLLLTYFFLTLAIQGFGQQEAYDNLSTTLQETGGELFSGNFGQVSQAGLLLVTSVTSGLTPSVTEAQSVLGGLAVFFAWLATVWALRNVMAGRRIRVRDTVYSSGAPVLSTVVVAFALVVQLLPIAIATLVYQAAIASELISGGVEQMMVWIVLALLGVLSLYWITSTVIALVVVTLPGMYPFQAIKTAGDLIIGRRLRVLLRLVWVAALTIIIWAIIVIPLILLDAWVKQAWPAINWIPFIPMTILFMSSVSIIALAAYIYMLYRKVVDDDAKPA
ncbi:hypothetical protein A2707_02155 [Candidatus Saccharibacteria bacterium RIFCSPHIGHO2_01_FULL_45_15]|nr:MAG: hypothetical protein A2707_02155 [Candidatus Saccharibacteria bacterium RIFCSPHIGHO2_01_FULL_45_15]OGL27597.1 MAG: hypothetical protein A3C39_00535 [Candidatus Saccharibacteria bacterium RIFCSPHIGHO2_02_FULL_46_12]OGL31619.1 MAG: hypothetical protein A3E76_00685 [Candidatus Saccharibacteria bacterium RIFCSPHIGHO2_12_FULL_44_22]